MAMFTDQSCAPDQSLIHGGFSAVDAAGVVAGVAGAARGSGGDCPVGGCVDPGSLKISDLKDLVVGLVSERACVEGRYVAALGELTSRIGSQAAAHLLRDLTRMNAPQARSESRLAESLVEHDFTETLDAMRAGRVQMSHARVIAREAPKKHRRSEEDFLELSRLYPSDLIARHPFAYQSQQVDADVAAETAAKDLSPADAELALQRHRRWASLRMGDDGMWHLHAKFDFLTGRQLSGALQAAVRSARRRHERANDRHPNTPDSNDSTPDGDRHASTPGGDAGSGVAAGPTRAQLTADAFADLMLGSDTARRAATSLVIVADYDTVNDRLANPRLDDGTPLSAQQLIDHGTGANVLAAMFNADWSQLALGRTRNANDAQRLILAVRDQGCIGCELTAEHTQAHHIDHYEHDGLTEIPNLASMCPDCHNDLHQHHRRIHTPPNGKPQLQPPLPHNTDPPERSPTSNPATQHQPEPAPHQPAPT